MLWSESTIDISMLHSLLLTCSNCDCRGPMRFHNVSRPDTIAPCHRQLSFEIRNHLGSNFHVINFHLNGVCSYESTTSKLHTAASLLTSASTRTFFFVFCFRGSQLLSSTYIILGEREWRAESLIWIIKTCYFPAESKSFSSQLSILSLCDRHTRQMLCHGTNTARSLLHKTAGENEELTQSRWSLTPVKIMCVIEFFLLFLLASHSIYCLCWLLPDVLRKGRRRATTTQIYSLNMASCREKKEVESAKPFNFNLLTYLIYWQLHHSHSHAMRRSAAAAVELPRDLFTQHTSSATAPDDRWWNIRDR